VRVLPHPGQRSAVCRSAIGDSWPSAATSVGRCSTKGSGQARADFGPCRVRAQRSEMSQPARSAWPRVVTAAGIASPRDALDLPLRLGAEGPAHLRGEDVHPWRRSSE
jgi:hypothetical protein